MYSTKFRDDKAKNKQAKQNKTKNKQKKAKYVSSSLRAFQFGYQFFF